MIAQHFELVDVAPVGAERVGRIACSSGRCIAGEVEVPVYPTCAEAEELRAARQGVGLSQGQAAKILGIEPEQLVALEHRRRTFVDPAGWRRAIDTLRSAPLPRKAGAR